MITASSPESQGFWTDLYHNMFGYYEEAPEPTLLMTPAQEQAQAALEELAYGDPPCLGTVNLPQVSLPQMGQLPELNLPTIGEIPELTLPTIGDLPQLNLPDVSLPGVTGSEQQLLDYGMQQIQGLMSGEMPEAYEMGMEEIKKTLGETYDPFTSSFYQGLREASMREEEAGMSSLRRRSQLGGMVQSDPSRRTEAGYRGEMGTGRQMMLGEMYETERGRKQAMIPQLLSYGQFAQNIPSQVLQGIQGLSPLAGKSGDIARQEAIINQQTGVQQETANWQADIGKIYASQQIGAEQATANWQAAMNVIHANQATMSQQEFAIWQAAIDKIYANQGINAQEILFNAGQQTQQAIINQEIGAQQALLPYTHQLPAIQSLAQGVGTWSSPEQIYNPGILDYAVQLAPWNW